MTTHNIKSSFISKLILYGEAAGGRTGKCKSSDFLLTAGGAVTYIEYWYVNVFRVGHNSSHDVSGFHGK